MDLPLRGVAIYNPALLSKEELVAQFIARRPLLELILSDLRKQDRPDHRILIGPRGMGKTTLLRRIHFAVEDDPALALKWIALPFPEEQYNLTRLSDFYLNCVDALGDALVHLGRGAEAEALDRRRDALPDDNEKVREEAALKLLLSSADGLKRKLILLIDNIEMVLERLSSSQWKLRELFGHDGRLCVIGASAFTPDPTYEYGKAFYEFFRVHELRPLVEAEAREVLLHLSKVRKAPEIGRIVREEPARVRTLLTLAGGNPRTLVQLYAVLSQSSEGDARSDLERLLDECTPIYKARFEALSVQAQQIIDAVALHWHPSTVADIAAITRLDPNGIASQVNRLFKEGVIEAVQAPEGTRKTYQIAERFFNIWYLMRASRRVRQRLVWLVESLRMIYGQDEPLAKPYPRSLLIHDRFNRGLVDAETEQLARKMATAKSNAYEKLLLARVLVRRGSLDEPVNIARDVLTRSEPPELERSWGRIVELFAEITRAKGAATALQLLQDFGFSERWLPLHAALTALRDGEKALLAFSPEVRNPAEQLLTTLQQHIQAASPLPDSPVQADPAPLPATPRKLTRPRKKSRPAAPH